MIDKLIDSFQQAIAVIALSGTILQANSNVNQLQERIAAVVLNKILFNSFRPYLSSTTELIFDGLPNRDFSTDNSVFEKSFLQYEVFH